MGNFTASEILTVIVVILIVFGPNRLPELARKAGTLAASARRAMNTLRAEIDAEYGDVIAPLRDARDELRAAGTEVKGQMEAFGNEVTAAGNQMRDTAKEQLTPAAGNPADNGASAEDLAQSEAEAAPAPDLTASQDSPPAAAADEPPAEPKEATGD